MTDAARPLEGHEDMPKPRVPAPLETVTEAAFAALARLRGARSLHPKGVSFTATLTPRPGHPLAFLGDEPREALVRCSNAVGLPAWMPDVFGLAIRIPGVVHGHPQDFLLSSAGEAPLARHLLLPARGYNTVARYSSLVMYRHAGRLQLVGARYSGPALQQPLRLADLAGAVDEGQLVFTLAVSAPTGRWQPIAELRPHQRLPVSASQRLRFNPWNSAPQLRPVGPLNHLRAAAYTGSQRTATSE